MSYKFSLELRAQLIAYFSGKYQVEISQELADEYLDSMADLYMAFSSQNAMRDSSDAKRTRRPQAFSS